jgi:hypothetical protein
MQKQSLFISLLPLTTLLLTACPSDTPPVLQGAIGTYNFQITPSQPQTQVGTAITLKLRLGTSRTTAPASISIVGPAGWNNNQALNLTYPTGSDWILSPEQDIPPVLGEYNIQVSTTSNNQVVKTNSKLSLSDTSALMPLSSISLSNISQETVTGKWNADSNAQGYISRLINATDSVSIVAPIYSTQPEAVFPNGIKRFSLNPSKTNLFVVNSTNFDTVIDNPTLPSQVNYSDSAEFIPVPSITPSAARATRRTAPITIIKP